MRLQTGPDFFIVQIKITQIGILIWRPAHLHPLSIFDTVNKQINAQSTPAGCCAIMTSY